MARLKNTWTTGDSFAATDVNDISNAVSALNQAGPYGSLPAPAFLGRLYFCTDIDMVLKDSGTSWDIAQPANFTAPPMSWTTTTMGSSTSAADKGGRLLTVPSATGDNWRIEYRTLAPTINYTFTVYIEHMSAYADSSYAGLVLRESSSGKFVTFGPDLLVTSSGIPRVRAMKWTNATTYSTPDYGTPRTAAQLPAATIPKWYRIRDDGTNRIFEHSLNGLQWMPFFSIGRTDFITPDQIGWGMSNSTGSTAYMRLSSFNVA